MSRFARAPLLLFSGVLLGALMVLALFYFNPDFIHRLSRQHSLDNEERLRSALQNQRNLFRNFDDIFDEDFFQHDDPFAEMRRLRERMEKEFFAPNGSRSLPAQPFDSWFEHRFGGGRAADISRREDDRFVFIEVKLEGMEGSSVRAEVQDGYLIVTGETKREEAASGGPARSVFRSTFRRSLPLPRGVDVKKMEMSSEKDRIVLKFPKLGR